MNKQAKKHLAAAEKHLLSGDKAYHAAAREIVAAKNADTGLSNALVASRLGRSESWVARLVAWHRNPDGRETPFEEPERETRDIRGARAVLTSASVETVQRLIADLPQERQVAVRAAALRPETSTITVPDWRERELNLPPDPRWPLERALDQIRKANEKHVEVRDFARADELLRELQDEFEIYRLEHPVAEQAASI